MRCLDVEGFFDFGIGRNEKMEENEGGYQEREKDICGVY